jgi:hypothetical protein
MAWPYLVQSGAGPLAWWRLRNSGLSAGVELQELHNAYIASSIHASAHERQVVEAFHAFRASGLEPILIKGWAVGRLYAEPGLRPAGDIDLCVSPEQIPRARALIGSDDCTGLKIDLKHDEITRFTASPFSELLERSVVVNLDGAPIRVLGAEDHLRILCLHLLKHGAWRPLWLCDIAVALESRPADFEWKRCLGANPRQGRWILGAIGLAQQLLGAIAGNAPQGGPLPSWLMPSVLRQWGAPYYSSLPPAKQQIGIYSRHPREMWRDLRRRWRNPIQATIDVNGPFNELPRLPFQLADYFWRSAQLLPGLPRSLRKSHA